ncbi:MAG: hypothetical protein SYC29_03660 [Planctomycetota bacterium]|nr:hypothetical protein [Planctomycetota bacterium]
MNARMTGRKSIAGALAIAGLLLLTPAAGAGEIEVIFTEVPGHPTAQVPGAVDENGDPVDTEFKSMEILSVSPDGGQWILKGRNWLGSELETMLLLGAGTEGAVFAQEGQPVHDGQPAEVYDFFGSSPPNFNELGQFIYTARARDGDPATRHKGIFFDGTDFIMVREMSDPALGLVDLPPGDSGDELFGNSFNSVHLLNDGSFGSHDPTIQNIHSSRRPAVFYKDTAFLQTGISPVGDSIWDDMAMNTFWTTPDGTRWILEGKDAGAENQDLILVVDDVVVLREGSAIPGSGIILADIFHTKLIASGDWFCRGDDPADNDWAVRSGALLAATGDPVVAGEAELWTHAFYSFTGNRNGDWVLAGTTDNPDIQVDSVIALNGEEVVVREGDPVDLDGNGMFDDDAFIGRGDAALDAFRPDDIFLTDDGMLYFFCSLRNAAGEDLGSFGTGGDAFLRLAVGAECPADFDGDGDVDTADLLHLLACWGTDCGDVDGDGDTDTADLLALLAAWGECP